jgi:hypothetical protein
MSSAEQAKAGGTGQLNVEFRQRGHRRQGKDQAWEMVAKDKGGAKGGA